MSHTLTGVWVEINCWGNLGSCWGSHPHGCVSWNLGRIWEMRWAEKSHPHGCVSWNERNIICGDSLEVTPSRVCELKSKNLCAKGRRKSHPHGCVSWNGRFIANQISEQGHTLTGVWVEIMISSLKDALSHCHTLTGVWVEILSDLCYW